MEKENNINMSGQPMMVAGEGGVGDGGGGVSHFIPNEQWRDGLCDCCTFGCCHAMCCLGYWCQPSKFPPPPQKKYCVNVEPTKIQ